MSSLVNLIKSMKDQDLPKRIKNRLKNQSEAKNYRIPVKEIEEGKHPRYNNTELLDRGIAEKMIAPVCASCGCTQHRGLSIGPFLHSHHVDHSPSNHKFTNIKALCPNCHQLEHRNPDLIKKILLDSNLKFGKKTYENPKPLNCEHELSIKIRDSFIANNARRTKYPIDYLAKQIGLSTKVFITIAKGCWSEYYKTDRGMTNRYNEDDPRDQPLFEKVRELLKRYPEERLHWIYNNHKEELKLLEISENTFFTITSYIEPEGTRSSRLIEGKRILNSVQRFHRVRGWLEKNDWLIENLYEKNKGSILNAGFSKQKLFVFVWGYAFQCDVHTKEIKFTYNEEKFSS